jgi:hypothetical protein
MTDREERVSRNEVLFREVNERIEEIQTGEGVAGRFDFVCECGDKNCVEVVNLTLAEYEGIRSEPTHFVVLPGHEVVELERTVQTGDHFSVVRKLDEAGEFAEQHDPRS